MSTKERHNRAGCDDIERLRAERDTLRAEVRPQRDRRRRTSELPGDGRV